MSTFCVNIQYSITIFNFQVRNNYHILASFRLANEQERRVEFAFEGQRWFDLVRTGREIPVLNFKATQIGIKKTLTDDNLVFPVPQSQVDINSGGY